MSQAKVDRYKQEKANRKKTMKKEKMKRTLSTGCAAIVGVAVIGWVGYSAYGYFRAPDNDKVVQTEVDLSAINDYMTDVSSTGDGAE